MKKVFLSALLLAGIGTSLTSCDNGDYTATPAGGTTWTGGTSSGGGGKMSAKVNGTQWNASSGMYSKTMGLTLMGMTTDQKSISISLGDYKSPGTYKIGSGNSASWLTGTTLNDMHIGTSGEVVITSDANNTVKGTFHFEGKDLTVTDGTFNLSDKL